MTRLREETRGYANHESAAYRDHLQVAAQQHADLMNNLRPANEKNLELEQQLYNYTNYITLMQQRAADQSSQIEQQRMQVQYESYRMQYDMSGLKRQTTSSSLHRSDGSQMPGDIPGRDESLPA